MSPTRWAALSERQFRPILIAVLGGLLVLAWINRFITDDGFIVFRFADNLIRGHGLVFNPGERVEGYTCFLYAVLIAAGMRIGLDPIVASYLVGFLAAIGTLLATCSLAGTLFRSRLLALAAVILVGTHYTFSAYVTGGLETQLQACFVTAFLAVTARVWNAESIRPPVLAAASVLAACALLTRLDSAVLLVPAGLLLLLRVLGRPASTGQRALGAAALLVPAIAIVGAWLLWKLSFYGSVVPNTFVAKVQGVRHLGRGLRYVYFFFTEYWLGPAAILLVWQLRPVLAVQRSLHLLLLFTVGLWVAYLINVGGDFMEFRMFVPVVPAIMLLMVRLAAVLEERQPRLGLAFASILVVGSLQHAVMYPRVIHSDKIADIKALDPTRHESMRKWVEAARTIHGSFPADSLPMIATFASGAVPYYSKAPTIDLVGLTDAWVARNGDRISPAAGHERLATFDYLLERRVNLLIGNPWIVSGPVPEVIDIDPGGMPRYAAGQPLGQRVPDGMRALEIPIDDESTLIAQYLVPSPAIERLIAAGKWRVHPVRIRTGPTI